MRGLRSYVAGRWHEGGSDLVPVFDPSTEKQIAHVSTSGVDFAAVLDHARRMGGPALREMTFAERGDLLLAMSDALRNHRDELLLLSRVCAGTTEADGAFDVDGASGTLRYYGKLAQSLGEGAFLAEEEGTRLGRSEAFWGRHVLMPRKGVAVHINAFNFPAWGFAEKAACALLAGMPVITKPATATSWVTERCIDIVIHAHILPEGALQSLLGGTGDLLDRLGPQDVVAFTGSADTARKLAARESLRAASTRFNVEADSLNAAVLAPGVAEGATFDLFVKDVVREVTQKTGQKCTAVRRILAPAEVVDRVQEALAAALGQVVTGNPSDPTVTMGPLATAEQLDSTVQGASLLAQQAKVVVGGTARVDGVGSPPGKGYFFSPTLLRAQDTDAAPAAHEREVFGPLATLFPYDGSAAEAARIVALGGGMLVTSLYGEDRGWIRQFLRHGGSDAGRVYIGSEASAGEAPGSGAALPQALHGGPGRAGGGEELGGLAGVRLYMQRVALQGSKDLLDGVVGGTEE